jgi:Flavin containing amine oxidoreductase
MGIVPSADEVNYWSDAYQDDRPHLVNQDDVEPVLESYLGGFEEFLDNYPDDDPQDMPLGDASEEYAVEEGITGDNELLYDLALDSNIVAEYAASLGDLSRWWWDEDEALSGGDAIIAGDGYSGVISWYANDIMDKIRLGANVTAIDWSDPALVYITFTQGGTEQTVRAEKVVVTVPLGVLKRGAIAFVPSLPRNKTDAIDNLGMGLLNKCIMKWNSSAALPWPNDLGWMERIATLGNQGNWTEFFSLERDTQHKVVIAWTAGRVAERVEQLDDESIQQEVMASLAAMFGDGAVPPPEEWIISRWLADEWSSGSYSYHGRLKWARPDDDVPRLHSHTWPSVKRSDPVRMIARHLQNQSTGGSSSPERRPICNSCRRPTAP